MIRAIFAGFDPLPKCLTPKAHGNHFSTGGPGQKSSFIMQHDTLIIIPPLEIVLIVNAE